MTQDLLIVGTGALATLFAARLSKAGVAVSMLGTWQEGLNELQKYGARLDEEPGQPIRAFSEPQDIHPVKAALVMVKSWQTERAAEQLVDCLTEDGLAISFQNGLGNEAVLARRIGAKRVARGVVTLGANQVGPGAVRSGGEGTTTLEAHPSVSDILGMLRVARFDPVVVEDIRPAVWGKLVVNSAINPLTALLRIKNGDLMIQPPAVELLHSLALEAAEVAHAVGITLPFRDPIEAVENIVRKTAENRSSMLQDVQRGSMTEVDVINGAIVTQGDHWRVPVPVNSVIWSLVKAIPVRGNI